MALTTGQARLLQRLRERHSPLAVHHHYSRFVRVMKLLLPSLAVVLLGLTLAWPRMGLDEEHFRIGFAALNPKAVQSLAMVNARYFGLDENNRPFTVTADVARQQDGHPEIIDLESPKADFTGKDGSGVFLLADTGRYRQKDQFLDLNGNVSLFHEKGYELHTEAAQVDLKGNTAHGERPVQGHGPQGRLEGEGFIIRDKGEDVVVTGRSSLVLKGAGSQGAKPARKAQRRER